MANQTLVSIQHLRAIAALGVVLFHVAQWTWVFSFPTGAAGVDLFFVVSGFILWVIAERAPLPPLAFLRRRLARIAPPYWIVTTFALIAALVWPRVFIEIQPDLGHYVKSLLFIPHRDPEGEPFPLLPPGWTLIYEAFFYSVFALCLFAPQRRRLWLMTIILVLVGLSGFLVDDIYLFGGNLLQLEFVAGLWIGKLWTEGRLPPPAWSAGMLVWGAAALILLQAIGFDSYFWRPLFWGGPAALIVLGAVGLEARGAWPRAPLLTRLGDASFSIYLCHPLAVAAVGRLVVGADRPELFIPLAVAASVGAGLLCRQLIEKPTLTLLAATPRRSADASP